MIHFNEWIKRLFIYLKEMEKVPHLIDRLKYEYKPAIGIHEILTLENALLPAKIPIIYKTIIQHNCSLIKYEYSIKSFNNNTGLPGICGQCIMFNARELIKDISRCRNYAMKSWIRDSPYDRECWMNTLPFAALINGDYLGMDLRSSDVDPPVVYLSHDNASRIIGKTFSEFLIYWEKINYIGPEIWMLEPYCDADGYVNGDCQCAMILREYMRTLMADAALKNTKERQ